MPTEQDLDKEILNLANTPSKEASLDSEIMFELHPQGAALRRMVRGARNAAAVGKDYKLARKEVLDYAGANLAEERSKVDEEISRIDRGDQLKVFKEGSPQREEMRVKLDQRKLELMASKNFLRLNQSHGELFDTSFQEAQQEATRRKVKRVGEKGKLIGSEHVGAPAAWVRDLGVASFRTVASLNSVAFRAGGLVSETSDQIADEMNRVGDYYGQIAAEKDVDEGRNLLLHRGVRGAAESLAKMVVLRGAGAGPSGISTAFGVDAANSAITEARDAGLQGADIARHAAMQGIIEGGIATIFNMAGKGGLEQIIGSAGGVKEFTKSGLKQLVRGIGRTKGLKATAIRGLKNLTHEQIEEISTTVAQQYASATHGVSPEAINSENMGQALLDTIIQTTMAMGAAQAPAAVQAGATAFDRAVGDVVQDIEVMPMPTLVEDPNVIDRLDDQAQAAQQEQEQAAPEVAAVEEDVDEKPTPIPEEYIPAGQEKAPEPSPGEEQTYTAANDKTVVQSSVSSDDLKVDPKRFQFKRSADPETGVAKDQPIQGDINRAALGKIVVYEEENGDQYIVSGHHRLDAIREAGEPINLNADILRESEGWTPEEAKSLGAEINILEGGGEVDDYAAFFRDSDVTPEQAKSRGLLRTPSGKDGFAIGKDAGEEVYTRFINGKLEGPKAAAIASAAPNDDAVQKALLSYVAKNKPNLHELKSFAGYLASKTTGVKNAKTVQASLFGGEDTTEIDNMAAESSVAAAHAADLHNQARTLDGIRKAGKKVSDAQMKKFGITTGDARAIKLRVGELRRESEQWSKFWLHPEIAEQVRQEAGTSVKPTVITPAEKRPAAEKKVEPKKVAKEKPAAKKPVAVKKAEPKKVLQVSPAKTKALSKMEKELGKEYGEDYLPVKTGQAFEVDGYKGTGKGFDDIYAEGATGPILGEASYVAYNKQDAEAYGKVSKHKVSAKSPYVVNADQDVTNVMKKPIPEENAEREAYFKQFRTKVEARGHDAIVVNVAMAADTDAKGRSNKHLQAVFGHSQIVSFLAAEDIKIPLEKKIKGFTPVPGKGGMSGSAMSYRYTGMSPAEVSMAPQHNLVRMAEAILGSFPGVVKAIRAHGGRALGVFRSGSMAGKINIRHDVAIGPMITEGYVKNSEFDKVSRDMTHGVLNEFPELSESDIEVRSERGRNAKEKHVAFYRIDPTFAGKVIAHEIGHAIDWVVGHTLRRGNILGRIGTLRRYMGRMIEAFPEMARENPDGGFEHLLTNAEGKARWAKIQNDIRKAARSVATSQYDTGTKEWKREYAKNIKEMREAWQKEHRFVTRDLLMDELKALTQAWNPFDVNADQKYTKYRHSSSELYAEAMSVLLNDPLLFSRVAPNFSRAFFAYLERKPDIRKIYDDIQSDIKFGDDGKKMREKIRADMESGSRVMGELRAKDTRFWTKIWEGLKAALPMFVSKNHSLRKQYRKDLKAGLVTMKYGPRKKGVVSRANDPHSVFERALGTGSEIEVYLERMGRVLEQVRSVGVDYTTWGEFLLYNRVIEERSKMFNPHGVTKDTAQGFINEIKDAMGEYAFKILEDARQQFSTERREIISRLKKSGLYSEELIKKMNSAEYYSKFLVVEHLEERGQRALSAVKKLYKQRGTFKGVVNPMEATLWQDVSLIYAANWNMAKRASVQYMKDFHGDQVLDAKEDREWRGDHMEYVDKAPDGYKLIQYMEGGNVHGVYMPTRMASAFDKERDEDMTAFLQMAHALGGLTRKMFTTWSAGFNVLNPQRDITRAVLHLPDADFINFMPHYFKAMRVVISDMYGLDIGNIETDGLSPRQLIDKMKELKSILASNNVYGAAREEGLMSQQMSEAMGFVNQDTGALVKAAKVVNVAGRVTFGTVAKVGETLERIPKVAGDMYLREHFPEMSEEERSDWVRRFAGSPNFLDSGHFTHIPSAIMLFMNPQVQSLDSAYSLLADPKYKLQQTWKYMKYVAVPRAIVFGLKNELLLAAAGLVLDDDDPLYGWIKYLTTLYRGIPEYFLRNYICIPVGMDENGNTEFLRFAQDQTMQFLGAMTWESLKMAPGSKEDMSVYKGIVQGLSAMAGEMPSVNPALSQSANIAVYMGGGNPYDYRLQRPIVRPGVFATRDLNKGIFDVDNLKVDLAMFKHVWNQVGGGSVYRFPSGYSNDKDRGQLAKWLKLPGVQLTVGKVLTVGSSGLKEEERRAKKVKSVAVAREREGRRLPSGELTPKRRKGSKSKGYNPFKKSGRRKSAIPAYKPK